MLTLTHRCFVALLLALPACSVVMDDRAGGSDGGSVGDDSADVLDDETAAQESGGSDPGSEEPAAPPELLGTCDLRVPCEHPVELVRESGSKTYAASDLCALKVLADEGGGLVQTVAAFASAESYLDHVVVGPGEVLRQAYGRSDGLGLWHKPVERCTLREPAFFAACAQDFDAACLDPDQWVADCEALDGLTCPVP